MIANFLASLNWWQKLCTSAYFFIVALSFYIGDYVQAIGMAAIWIALAASHIAALHYATKRDKE